MKDNVAIIEEIFSNLEKGDINAILEKVDPKITWQSPVSHTALPEIPWSGYRKSKKEVVTFFDELGKYVNPKNFEILETTRQDDRVVVEGKNRVTIKENNKTYEHNWVMIFTFKNGKVTRFRHYYDSADLVSHLKEVTLATPKAGKKRIPH